MTSEAGLSEQQRCWLERLRECEESGQTTKAYAESRGLSVSALYTWRKRLAKRGLWPSKVGLFDRVAITGGERLPAEWRIVLPNGIEVVFSGSVDGAQLSTVLSAAARAV